jgi:signal transduction protein with GAF and PtsI domain
MQAPERIYRSMRTFEYIHRAGCLQVGALALLRSWAPVLRVLCSPCEGRMAGESIGDLKKCVNELVRKGDGGESFDLNRVVDLVSKQFGVQHHEVAIFILSTDGKFLRFIVPEKLQAVGQIPTTSANSLVARTAREKRPEIINLFSIVPHASVFEAVPLVEEQRGDPIQKIMSAPMLHEKKLIGVMQISRKGKSAAEAGPDFTQAELHELRTVADIVAPCLPLCIKN